MKRITLFSFVAALVSIFIFSTHVQASGDHAGGHDDDHNEGMEHNDHHDSGAGHGDHHDEGMEHKKGEMFLKKKTIDGYDVSFHIMKSEPDEQMGGSYNFMIKIEKNDKVLSDVVINTKVVHPNGKTESKRVMKMGDWYMAGYDLGHEGKHQVMILFKTADGQKHKGGIYY